MRVFQHDKPFSTWMFYQGQVLPLVTIVKDCSMRMEKLNPGRYNEDGETNQVVRFLSKSNYVVSFSVLIEQSLVSLSQFL